MYNSFNSKEYNEILIDNINRISDIDKKIEISNKKIEDRLKILTLQEEHSYILKEKISKNFDTNNILPIESVNDDYGVTGITAHPSVIGGHNNLFNLSVSKEDVYHFREDVIAKIEEENVTFILQHDSILDKSVKIIETNRDNVELSIEKTSEFMGPFVANSFSVDTYIRDLINFKSVVFYNKDLEVHRLDRIDDVGKSLHPLNKVVSFDRVVFDIEIKNKINDKYYIPIKSLYFFNSLYYDKSYCIYEKDLDNFLLYIEDKVGIYNHDIYTDSTLTKEGIEIYADADLQRKIIPDTNISRNVKKIYIKIPLFFNGKMRSIKSVKLFEKYR